MSVLRDPDEELRKLIKVLEKVGARADLIYAVKKTGRMVTESNRKFLTADELREWNDAIDEFRRNDGIVN